jgi:hypothetical protein
MFAETATGRSVVLSLLQLAGLAFAWFWLPIALNRGGAADAFAALPEVPPQIRDWLRPLAAVLSVLGIAWAVNGAVGLIGG